MGVGRDCDMRIFLKACAVPEPDQGRGMMVGEAIKKERDRNMDMLSLLLIFA